MHVPDVLLDVRDATRYFAVRRGLWRFGAAPTVKAVDGVSFSVESGKTFGLVGESGCGKTTTAKLILLLEAIDAGTIRFRDIDIASLDGTALRRYRKSVQAVLQDPYSSLSPRMRVGEIIGEPLRAASDFTPVSRRERVGELLTGVGLRSDAADLFPHEFSGGQRQRIAIARALATEPELIVLDEPVSALDVSIRAQVINLLSDIQERTGVAFLLIAHDLAVVKHMSHSIGVMYLGRLVETAAADELHRRPLHPYTQALLGAALPAHPDDRHQTAEIAGEVPSPLNPPSGCRFRTRCPMAMARCAETVPILADKGAGHHVACHLV